MEKKTFVKMGSYGIGVSRLVAAIIEAKYVNEKMKWPISVSPFDVVIIPAVNKNDKSNLHSRFGSGLIRGYGIWKKI